MESREVDRGYPFAQSEVEEEEKATIPPVPSFQHININNNQDEEQHSVDCHPTVTLQKDGPNTTEATTHRDRRAATLLAMGDSDSNLSQSENASRPGAFPIGGLGWNDEEEQYASSTLDNERNTAPFSDQPQSYGDRTLEAELVDDDALRAEILGDVTPAEVVPKVAWLQRYRNVVFLGVIVAISSVGTAIGLVFVPSPPPAMASTANATSTANGNEQESCETICQDFNDTSVTAKGDENCDCLTSEEPASVLPADPPEITCNPDGDACACGKGGDGSLITLNRYFGDNNDEQVWGCGGAFMLNGASWGASWEETSSGGTVGSEVGFDFSQQASYHGWEGCCFICGANLQLAGKLSPGWYCEKNFFSTGVWLKGVNT